MRVYLHTSYRFYIPYTVDDMAELLSSISKNPERCLSWLYIVHRNVEASCRFNQGCQVAFWVAKNRKNGIISGPMAMEN